MPAPQVNETIYLCSNENCDKPNRVIQEMNHPVKVKYKPYLEQHFHLDCMEVKKTRRK